jgi:hypothetical protein
MRIKIVATINFERMDDDGIKWSTSKQIPTFWVEASSHKEATQIAQDIMSLKASIPISWNIDTMTDYPARNIGDEIKSEEDDDDQKINDNFDRILANLVNRDGIDVLMSVPDIYDAVRKHYNDDVLEELDKEQEQSDE